MTQDEIDYTDDDDPRKLPEVVAVDTVDCIMLAVYFTIVFLFSFMAYLVFF